MESLIFHALQAIYGGGVIVETADFLKSIMTALTALFEGEKLSAAMTVFTSMSGALMIIFFYMDLASQASRDIITLEKLVTSSIKFMIALIILIYLKEIIIALFNLCHAVYEMASHNLSATASNNIKFFPGYFKNARPGVFPAESDGLLEYIKKGGNYKSSIKGFLNNFSLLFTLIVPYLLSTLAKYAAFFIAISNSLTLIVEAIFAPLGVVQLFDDGQRSTGIRYLKRFTATALSFAVILAILYACALLQQELVNAGATAITSIDVDNMKDVFGSSAGIKMVVIQFGCVGLLFKSQQVAREIVGV